jgi:signal transduction histidine kinase
MGTVVTIVPRGRRLWPWLVGAFAIAVALASVPLLVIDWPTFKPGRIEPIWVTALDDVIGPVFAVTVVSVLAGFILSRRPASPLGWAFAAIGLLVAFTMLTQEYAVRALVAAPGSLPAGDLTAWIGTWTGLAIFPQVLAILLFPDGRLPGRVWWAVAGLAALITAATIVSSLGDPWPLHLPMRDGSLPVTMPPSLWTYGFALAGDPQTVLGWSSLLLAPAAAALVLVRTRRAQGDERFQLRWLAFALAITAVFWMVGNFDDNRVSPWAFDTGAQVIARWGQLGSNFAITFVVPAAIAVAIFKYRLFDIDVVISRTLLFGSLAAFITLTYIALVFGVGSLIGAGAGLGQVLALLATAIVAVVFQPLRDVLSRLANKLVYGERRTPYEVLSGFGSRAALSYSADEVLPQLAALLREATGAERAEAWLRVGAEIRRVAVHPASTQPPGIPVERELLPVLPDADYTVPVRHGDELLGALAITKRRGDRVTPGESKLLDDLASQTALVLRNLRLVEELRASRERIVRAQDEERRRVERNLHDGAQQRLVALSLVLGRARAAAQGSTSRAGDVIATAEGELRAALGELRELAQGIHPTILVTGGLEPALRSLADRSPVPVEMDISLSGRPPAPAEAAAYYIVSEALTNVAKHAHASSARVLVTATESCLVIEVSDDGVGGAQPAGGGGLQGLEDRTAAIGGRISITSPAGAGTRLLAEIPCD